MASLNFQKEAAALLFSVLGQKATAATFDSIGNRIEKNLLSAEDYVGSLLNSAAGKSLYNGKSDFDILSSIYTSTYGKTASADYLSSLLAHSSLEESITTVVNDLLNYSGFDTGIQDAQNNYDQQLNEIMFPSYNAAGGAKGVSDIQALYYLVGIDPVSSTVNNLGSQINSGSKTFVQVATKFIDDRAALKALSNSSLVKLVYTEAYGRAPTDSELVSATSFLANGGSKGQMIVNLINDLRGTVAPADTAAQQHFLAATTPNAPGFIAALATQEQVASIFLALPERNVDAQGLSDWSNYLGNNPDLTKVNALTAKLITSSEFQKKGAQLTGNDYIQHVYTAVHGVAATAKQLADYAKLGTDKALIATMIINDLRTSTATDAAIVTQQHTFEYDIGSSLTYKTAASLSASASGGNATGTVNSGSSHVLSNAETAVLVNALLDANAATTVNLKFADHLANLTINGGSAATVNLSDNGVNSGVAITVNNGNVTLNASSGNDVVTVTADANLINGLGKFNLGNGNDQLLWDGNAVAGGNNILNAGISAQGGTGVNTLSANFLTTSSIKNFTNFNKIDIGGYVGSYEGKRGVFNDGMFQDNRKGDLSNEGYVLSKKADNVTVYSMMYGGRSKGALEITGNAGADSRATFDFYRNATNSFDINFTGKGNQNLDAGAITVKSHAVGGFLYNGDALTDLKIHSNGQGNFTNKMTLIGEERDSNLISNIKIDGDHRLALTLENNADSMFLNKIDASANSAGVDIISNINAPGVSGAAGGAGFLDFLKPIPGLSLIAVAGDIIGGVINGLGNVIGWIGGLFVRGHVPDVAKSYDIIGSAHDDNFTIGNNTSVTTGAGKDVVTLAKSTAKDFSTITDFSASDKIVDQASGISISSQLPAGQEQTQVKAYGFTSTNALTDIFLAFGQAVLGNVLVRIDSLKKVINIEDGKMEKVGVGGTDSGSYVAIDNNGNRSLDADDTLVFLKGINYADAQKLVYSQELTTNGVQQNVGDLVHG
ncbi:ABC-type protease/lipase transport system, ATPase and permease components [Serratia entomophila]|uniref:DUF4214 domain-containing protein n=1 Tax=Serratia entomophila TaxID=42906 RepID=UPI002178C697|nr:DUF4214 domain-containing protein [Serratia entomophila]CAI1157331.1 ABC-type protease/lipase transport system, ATPase and permease components [Serratia entomophila]